jgi:hypothetical protein
MKKLVLDKKMSTESAAYNLISEILNALNNRNLVGGTFVTLEKLLTVLTMAFYCLNSNFMVLGIMHTN